MPLVQQRSAVERAGYTAWLDGSHREGTPMSTTSKDSAAETRGAPDARRSTMKAVAVRPGQPNSIHIRDVPMPSLHDVPGARGVLVRVLRVGVDGTDKEINAAEYGKAPPADDYLILGHESFGVVEAVAPGVTELVPGDCVVATVRRPGSSPYDAIGLQDMTTDDTYFERGISLRHGFLAEHYADSADFLVKVPTVLRSVGVLLEPVSVAEKAIGQAFEIQRRLRVWRPKRALVLGHRDVRPAGVDDPPASRARGPGHGEDGTALSERGSARGDPRGIPVHARREHRRSVAYARAVRPDHRRHGLLAARLRGNGLAGQERSARPAQCDGRRSSH